jgi:hypothetical protein
MKNQQKSGDKLAATLPTPPELERIEPTPKLEHRALQPGRSYRLVFIDGKVITGQLVELDRWHLVIDAPSTSSGQTAGDDGGQRLLVYKHAIKYVVLGGLPKKGE